MRRIVPGRRVLVVASVATAMTATCAALLSAPTIASAGSGNPLGHLDLVTTAAATTAPNTGTITVRGWAADGDSSAPTRVELLVDGVRDATVLATGYRPDVARVFPSFGSQRGYSITGPAVSGTHAVCVQAINVGPGVNTRVGCSTVTVPGTPPAKVTPPAPTTAPFGHLDSVTYSAGSFVFSGWAIDPDSTAPILIDVTSNGTNLGSVAAGGSRPDVGRIYPAFGAAHGLRAVVPAPTTPGNYSACATAVNTSAGANTRLQCRLVTVPPSGVPATLGVSTASAAATALQQQAITSGAAHAADFPAGASSAARIAIAARALLQQATGRSATPPAVAGAPTFTVATTTKSVDEQTVMGRTPDLGSYPAARTGGRTGAAHSLELYANDPLPAPSSAGDGLVGAAPVLPANGTTVRPALPGYPTAYQRLRAEAAVDAALSQLGVPYVYAAAGPDSFDCSGLTEWAWAKAGVSLYHYTVTQATQGVRVQPNQLLPGDLVLFGSDLHHVGMYLGAGYMIDAPYTGAYVRVDQISAFGDFTLAVRP